MLFSIERLHQKMQILLAKILFNIREQKQMGRQFHIFTKLVNDP